MTDKKSSARGAIPARADATIKQPLKPIVYVLISAFGLLVTIGLLFLYIFKAHDLVGLGIEKQVFYVLLVPLGISAAAFLFGAMKGHAVYTGNVLSGKLKIVGPGVAAFLVVILGFILVPDVQAFNYTIYLKDSGGATVLKKDEASLLLTLGESTARSEIDENGAVDFKGIRSQFRGASVSVELEAKRWTFKNGKKATTCELKGNNAVLVVQPDDSLSKLSGVVTDDEGRFIQGATVSTKGIEAITDKNGWFSLDIPSDKQEEKLMVTIQKQGYENKLENAYPGNTTPLVFILRKEKTQ